MEYREKGGLILVRLFQNEDLFESLTQLCEACEVKTAIVLSGIGMLKQAELGFFVRKGEYSSVHFPEPMELVSLSGNIIAQGDDLHFHMHAVLARSTKEAIAGHLSKGKVNVTNEIVILKTDIPALREMDDSTGLMALAFK